jgi:hypothetical protein
MDEEDIGRFRKVKGWRQKVRESANFAGLPEVGSKIGFARQFLREKRRRGYESALLPTLWKSQSWKGPPFRLEESLQPSDLLPLEMPYLRRRVQRPEERPDLLARAGYRRGPCHAGIGSDGGVWVVALIYLGKSAAILQWFSGD